MAPSDRLAVGFNRKHYCVITIPTLPTDTDEVLVGEEWSRDQGSRNTNIGNNAVYFNIVTCIK